MLLNLLRLENDPFLQHSAALLSTNFPSCTSLYRYPAKPLHLLIARRRPASTTTSPPPLSLDASALVHMRTPPPPRRRTPRRIQMIPACRPRRVTPPRVTLPAPDTETKPGHADAYRRGGRHPPPHPSLIRHPNPANRPAAPPNPLLK